MRYSFQSKNFRFQKPFHIGFEPDNWTVGLKKERDVKNHQTIKRINFECQSDSFPIGFEPSTINQKKNDKKRRTE